MPQLDHLVYGVPDLDHGIADFVARTGIAPVPGGRHPGRGTANYLVGLGSGAYLEIIGPDPVQAAANSSRLDPSQPDASAGYPIGPRPFGLDTLLSPRLLTWCVRPSDLDQCLVDARSRGYDPGQATAMSRTTPDGEVLEWRLTPDSTATGGLIPFLIDWGSSTHPTVGSGGRSETGGTRLPKARLIALHATSPTPADVRRTLSTIGLILDVIEAAETSLHAVIDTPLGEVSL